MGNKAYFIADTILSASDDNKKSEKKPYWQSGMGKFTVFLIVAVLLWNTVQIWMMSGVVSSVNQYNLGAVDEMGVVVGDVKEFAADLNEIRRFLLLPEHQYGISGEVKQDESVDTEDNTGNAVALFSFLNSLEKEQLVANNRAAAQPSWMAFLSSADLSGKLGEMTLTMGEPGDLQVKFLDNLPKDVEGMENENFGQPLFNLIFSPEENLYRMQSVLGEELFADYLSEEFFNNVLNYLGEHTEEARQKKIDDVIKLQLASDEASKQALAQQDQQKKEFQDLIADQAFVDTLSMLGLKLAEASRHEINKDIYDILDQDGRVKFSLALELSSGQIKLLKDNQEIDLKNFMAQDGSKKKP